MILYHGSNIEVKEPKLLATQRELDFEIGSIYSVVTQNFRRSHLSSQRSIFCQRNVQVL